MEDLDDNHHMSTSDDEDDYDDDSSTKLGRSFDNTIYDEKALRDAAHAEVASMLNMGNFGDDSKESKKRKMLTMEDKAKQSRERNREHAKNTRLRKKAYVTKLKEMVDQMQKDKETEDHAKIALEMQQQEIRDFQKQQILKVFQYRSEFIRDKASWGKLFSDDVDFSLPITPYRYFPKNQICGVCRKFRGIDLWIADVHSLFVLVESMVQANDALANNSSKIFEAVETSYKISNDVLCINEDIAMCRYEFSVSGLHDKVNIVSQNGMMYVQFDKESRKIKELEMIFDVMSFMQQLQRSALLLPEQCIIPNTIEMALQHCIEARTLVTNSDPLCISYINEGWSSQFGCTQAELEGKSLVDFLKLPENEFRRVEMKINECRNGVPSSGFFKLYSNSMISYVKFFPLFDDHDFISHVLITISVPKYFGGFSEGKIDHADFI